MDWVVCLLVQSCLKCLYAARMFLTKKYTTQHRVAVLITGWQITGWQKKISFDPIKMTVSTV